MDPATRNRPYRSHSPLSSFLSNMMEETFGSTQVDCKIIADNSLSHGPGFCHAGSTVLGSATDKPGRDSISVARTVSTSSSSSSQSSSRWDPNEIVCAPIVPVRRDSPEQWYRKQPTEVATATKPIALRDIAATTDTSSTTFGDNSKTGSVTTTTTSSANRLTCPIRKLSLVPSDLLLPQDAPNFMQVSMHTTVPKTLRTLPLYNIKEEEEASVVRALKPLQPHSRASPSSKHKRKKSRSSHRKNRGATKQKSSSPQSPRPSISVPRTSVGRTRGNRSSSSPHSSKNKQKEQAALRRTALAAVTGLDITTTTTTTVTTTVTTTTVTEKEEKTVAGKTPPPFTIPLQSPPKMKKRIDQKSAVVRSVGFPAELRFPILPEDELDDCVDAAGLVLSHPSKQSALKPRLPSNGGEGNGFGSSRSFLVIQEGGTMLSGSVLPLSPVKASPSLPRADRSKQAEAKPRIIARNKNLQLPFTHQKAASSRSSSMMANRRSLSETLLSCDRDTMEDPSSPTLPSGSTLSSKRAPPVQPVRKLSRPLF